MELVVASGQDLPLASQLLSRPLSPPGAVSALALGPRRRCRGLRPVPRLRCGSPQCRSRRELGRWAIHEGDRPLHPRGRYLAVNTHGDPAAGYKAIRSAHEGFIDAHVRRFSQEAASGHAKGCRRCVQKGCTNDLPPLPCLPGLSDHSAYRVNSGLAHPATVLSWAEAIIGFVALSSQHCRNLHHLGK